VSSAPLPLLSGEAAERVRQDAGALMLVLCMTMAASVLSASFVVFLVRCDRVCEGYGVCLWLQDMIGIWPQSLSNGVGGMTATTR
jgi:hypothetical protein